MKYLCIDIETAREYKELSDAPDQVQELWDWYCKKNFPEETDFPALYKERTGLDSTFAKIVCISCSYSRKDEIVTKSYSSDNESDLLIDFADMLNSSRNIALMGHNIKKFDLPFIVQRMWKNEIEIPFLLQLWDKKPWEMNVVDTKEVFCLNDFSSRVSLHQMCSVLNVNTPKDGIDGSMVGEVYHNGGLQEIVEYCEKDTVATLSCANKMMGI